MELWYLSFAGEEGWRGCCFVRATDLLSAVSEAHRLECNPGGEVLGMPVPTQEPQPPAERIGHLLQLDDIRAIWPDVRSLREWSAEEEAKAAEETE
jgi:hypothetical protein